MTEILRHPSLPEVEPITDQSSFGWFVYVLDRRGHTRSAVDGWYIESPFYPTEAEAITAWNDWVRPLLDLQAERDRWLQLSKDYGERIESLEEEVAAVCAHRDEEKERAERYRATAELILDALESTGALPTVCKIFRAALTDQPEQPT